MTIYRIIARIIAPLSLFILAACQTTPSTQTDTVVQESTSAPQTVQESMPEEEPAEMGRYQIHVRLISEWDVA